MAGKEGSRTEQVSAEQAMILVLGAEQEAEQAVRACKADADAIRLAAQDQANRIETRTDERITRLQMRTSQRVAEAVRQLKSDESRARLEQAESYRIDDALIRDCIRKIAHDLTDGEPAATRSEEADE